MIKNWKGTLERIQNNKTNIQRWEKKNRKETEYEKKNFFSQTDRQYHINCNWRNYLICNICVFYNINSGYILKEPIG